MTATPFTPGGVAGTPKTIQFTVIDDANQQCSIQSITVSNISACNDQGTNDPGDDTFTADVTINFVNPPASGTLDLMRDGTASVAVGNLNSATSHTFIGVVMSADGDPISLMAAFSADPNCMYEDFNTGQAPPSCSPNCMVTSISVSNMSACNDQGTNNPFDDTFTADITVTYQDAPASGTLDLSGDASASINASFVGSASHTFLGVTMSADGGPINLTANFSADPSCTRTNNNAGTAPAACSNANCSVTSINTTNISACNDQGTSNPSDDTFTADVTIGFSNPPATGDLVISGDASGSVPVSSLSGSNYTFTGVTMSADGSNINISAFFSDNANCNLTNTNTGTAPASCSQGLSPSIQKLVLIDADTDQPIPQHDPLVNGAVLDKNQLPALLNVQAVTNPNTVGSVFFSLSGPMNSTRTENAAPYALFGDSRGNYRGRDLPVGNYTLTVTPYSGSNRSGTAGTPTTIQFSVVDNATFAAPNPGTTPEASVPQKLHLFPNPATDVLNVDLTSWLDQRAELQVKDMLGRTVLRRTIDQIQTAKLELQISELERGMYVLSLTINGERPISKPFMIQR